MIRCAMAHTFCVLQPTVTSHQDVFAEGDDDEDVEEAEIDAADI